MVTVNLLPWRPLSRHYRIKILRRIIIVLMMVTVALAGLIAAFFWPTKPLDTPTLKTLPSPSPVDPHLEAEQKASQLQHIFLSLLHSLDCIFHPGLHLTQITILPTSAQLKGRTDSLNAWLHFISALQKIWRVQVNDFQHTSQHGLSFSLTLIQKALSTPSAGHAEFFEIKSHTAAVQKMLAQLPAGLLLETLHPSVNDDKPSVLQVSGPFPTLIRFISSLHGNAFFCTADKIILVHSFTDIRLIFKWHFPCFGKRHPALFHYESRTDPFRRSPFPFFPEVSPACVG